MTEKEEKVIKSFKRYINFQESTIDDYYKMDEEYYKDQIEQLELSTQLLKTILNLIENQQIALEQKYKEIQELKEKWNKDTHILQNQLDLANADRVEKDKIIDLTVDFIDDIWTLDDEQEDCFIPREFSNIDDCIKKSCKACIKQYFKEKVSKEND